MKQQPDPAEAVEKIRKVVNFHRQGLICPSEMWWQVAEAPD